jgi:hypothetical protein
MLADGIAQAAQDGGQGTKALRQRRPGSVFKVQHHTCRAARIPGSRRVQADAARSPHRNRRGQRCFSDDAVEAKVAGQDRFVGGGDFQQDAARVRTGQLQQFLGPLAPDRGNDGAGGFRGKLRPFGIQPDAEELEARGRLPETLRRV